jgi:hypothetical protein
MPRKAENLGALPAYLGEEEGVSGLGSQLQEDYARRLILRNRMSTLLQVN